MILAVTLQYMNFIISQQQNKEIYTDQSDSTFVCILEFSQVFEVFDLLAQKEIGNKDLGYFKFYIDIQLFQQC